VAAGRLQAAANGWHWIWWRAHLPAVRGSSPEDSRYARDVHTIGYVGADCSVLQFGALPTDPSRSRWWLSHRVSIWSKRRVVTRRFVRNSLTVHNDTMLPAAFRATKDRVGNTDYPSTA
jgi:hypothetical protein